jgi:transposase
MKYALEQESILGVDTHLDVHVAAVINQSGQLLGTQSVSTNTAGYLQLFQWASAFGALKRAGVEGTGTYGAGLCHFLCDKGIMVLEVNRPDRASRRINGKSDSLDAENAARSVLSGVSKAIPKKQSGACEAMRIVSVARPYVSA